MAKMQSSLNEHADLKAMFERAGHTPEEASRLAFVHMQTLSKPSVQRTKRAE